MSRAEIPIGHHCFGMFNGRLSEETRKRIDETLKQGGFDARVVVEEDDDPARLTHEALRDHLVVYGSPETVARKVLALREKVGGFGTLLYAAHDWGGEEERMKRSMRLMAEEVMPRVNRALAVRDAAD